MSDEEEEFLKAIRLNPADDTARLVYADWLDEHADPPPCPKCKGTGLRPKVLASDANDYSCSKCGEKSNMYGHWRPNSGWACEPPECKECKGSRAIPTTNSDRAEYIRLQCELRKYPKQANWLEQMPVDQWKGGGEEGELLRRLAPLVKRNTELEKLHVRDCATWSREFISSIFGVGWINTSANWQWFWSRGFISEIHLPTESFFTFAAKIFAFQPITRVRFTDKDHWTEEGQEVLPEDDRSFCWWDRTPYRVEQDGPFDPGNIPTELFEIMWKNNPANRCEDSMSPEAGRWLRWDEPEIPQEELSAAGVEWGRKAAGLPPLRSCPSSMV